MSFASSAKLYETNAAADALGVGSASDPLNLNPRALIVARDFIRSHLLRVSGISILLLVPCFWHRHIEACDLGSHVYNAWLAQLIRRGEAPGLYLSGQWTNVLFDWLLSGFGAFFGLHVAERIAVSLAILVFFWGAFAFIAAATKRVPWTLVPGIAIVTFGYTFEMGFFNFYLSLGLSFLALALFLRGLDWEKWIAVAFVVPITIAHPIGTIWFVGALIYIALAEALPPFRVALPFLGAAALFAASFWLRLRYITENPEKPIYRFNGADQLLLYGDRYKYLFWALAAFVVGAIVLDMLVKLRQPRSRAFWPGIWISLPLYLLALLAVPLLPRGVTFGPNIAPIALLTERLTSVSALLALCVLGATRPKAWHLAALAAIASVFFAFLWQDTAQANRLESEADQLVSNLPPGQRVVASIEAPPDSRILIQHMIDRACIGRCFSYGNYEPSSGVFRVRVSGPNPYALDDYGDAVSTELGDYTVQLKDLPIYQVYECGDGSNLCIEPLRAGMQNDEDGVHPGDE